MNRRNFISSIAAAGLVPAVPVYADPAGGVNDGDVIDGIISTVNGADLKKVYGVPGHPEIRKISIQKMNPDMSFQGRIHWTYPRDVFEKSPMSVLVPGWVPKEKIESKINDNEYDFHRRNMGVGSSSIIANMQNATHDVRLSLNVVFWQWKEGPRREGHYLYAENEGGPLEAKMEFSMPFIAYGSGTRDPIKMEESPKKAS